MCGGSRADLVGRRVVTGDTLLDFIEVTEGDGRTELFSSDPPKVHLTSGLQAEAKIAENDPRGIGV